MGLGRDEAHGPRSVGFAVFAASLACSPCIDFFFFQHYNPLGSWTARYATLILQHGTFSLHVIPGSSEAPPDKKKMARPPGMSPPRSLGCLETLIGIRLRRFELEYLRTINTVVLLLESGFRPVARNRRQTTGSSLDARFCIVHERPANGDCRRRLECMNALPIAPAR